MGSRLLQESSMWKFRQIDYFTKNCYITADSPVGVFVMTSARLLQALKPAGWVNDRRSVSQSVSFLLTVDTVKSTRVQDYRLYS